MSKYLLIIGGFMSLVIKIALSILTLLTLFAMIAFTTLGIVMHQPLLVVVGTLLTIAFGMFVYRDAKFWLGKL